MSTCKCGFSTDEEKNCNGTHNVVKAVRESIAKEIEALSLDAGEPNSQLNALGMKMLVLDIIRGKKKQLTILARKGPNGGFMFLFRAEFKDDIIYL